MRRALVASLSIALITSLLACSFSEDRGPTIQAGEFRLVAAKSKIYFIGIKNNAVAVPGAFVGLSGKLSFDGRTGYVEIPINTLDTGLVERDNNIRTHFFEAHQFPLARFSVKSVNANEPTALELGQSRYVELFGTLEIHGKKSEITIPVSVTHEAPSRLRVHSISPFVLTAEQLGMEKQLAVLKAVCGHEALSGAVPISVDLVFEP